MSRCSKEVEMKANVFRGKNRIGIEEVETPRAGAGEAVIRGTLTTICGTDLHIVRGEYPVAPGLVIGHEPVGVIAELAQATRRSAAGAWARRADRRQRRGLRAGPDRIVRHDRRAADGRFAR